MQTFSHFQNQALKPTVSFSWNELAKIAACLLMVCCAIVVSIFLYSGDVVLHYQAAILPILLVTSVLSFHAPLQNYIHGNTEASGHNAAILYVLIRISLHVLLTTKIIGYKKQDFLWLNMGGLKQSFEDFSSDNTLITLTSVHVVTSFMLQILHFIHRRTRSIGIMVSIPITMAQIMSPVCFVLLCAFKSSTSMELISLMVCELHWNHTFIVLYVMCFVLVLVTICVIFISMCYSTPAGSDSINTPLKRYSSICLLQHLVISLGLLESTTTNLSEHFEISHKKRTRVYICTTMYQEAEHEMERLLKSLNKVALSKKLYDNNVFIESHIFLDNGANGKELKDIGKQLLSLVEANFELRQESGILLYTPYGIQLHWELEVGTSIFIHLKDMAKVKSKKRWSQVMYLKYILNFKAKHLGKSNHDLKNSESFSTYFYSSNESLDKLSDDESNNKAKVIKDNWNFGKGFSNQTQLHVPKAKFRLGPKTPSYGSLESLDGMQDTDLPGPINIHTSVDKEEIPDIVLYPSGDEGEGDVDSVDHTRGDVSSNDGSLVTGDVHIRSRELLVSELPTEIHTQDNTVFNVSVSR